MADETLILSARDRTQAAFQSLQRSIGRTSGTFSRFAAGAAAALGIAGFGRAVQQAIAEGDQLGKLAHRIGASTEALSELRHVAELSGVSWQQMTLGIQSMTRRTADAARGVGDAQVALRMLGIDARALKDLRPEEQFSVIADAMLDVANESEQAAIASRLFGEGNVALLQTMTEGSAGIARMRAEAKALGLSLSEEQVQQFAESQDALARLGGAFKGLASSLATSVGPILEKFASFLARTVGPAVETIRSALTGIGKLLGGVLAAANLALEGEWSAAASAIKAAWDDAGTAATKTADAASKAWEAAWDTSIDDAARTGAALAEVNAKAKKVFHGSPLADPSAASAVMKRAREILREAAGGRERGAGVGLAGVFDARRAAGIASARARPTPIESPVLDQIRAILERIERRDESGGSGAVFA